MSSTDHRAAGSGTQWTAQPEGGGDASKGPPTVEPGAGVATVPAVGMSERKSEIVLVSRALSTM